HKIIVLSRRPGRVHDIVNIDRPLTERGAGDPELEDVRQHLWELMRDEARAADRELLGA
ncbi:MAG: ABC transporter ATP-binding protein, partial [Desulforhopalus sp.]